MSYILSHIYLNINKSYHIQLHIKWKKWWHFVKALAKSKFVSTLYVIYRSYHIGSSQVSTERNHSTRLGSWDLKIATFWFSSKDRPLKYTCASQCIFFPVRGTSSKFLTHTYRQNECDFQINRHSKFGSKNESNYNLLSYMLQHWFLTRTMQQPDMLWETTSHIQRSTAYQAKDERYIWTYWRRI